MKTETTIERVETKQEEEEIKTRIEETKPAEAEKTKEEETEAPKAEVSPETLEREVAVVLVALSAQVKPKPKRKRQPSMYFKARKSTRINMGKPQPPSKEPITIEYSPTAKKDESPSRTAITYERGSPRSSTWMERIKLQDSKTVLQEVQTGLQETLTKLQETEKLKKKVEEQIKGKDEIEGIPEPNPQHSLGSYYNLLEGEKIIPQKFAIPLFFELERERVRSNRWMQIAKSKGVEDIGHMESKLREMGRELATVKHVEAVKRSHLEAENEMLRIQLQERETLVENEVLRKQLQERESQAETEILILRR